MPAQNIRSTISGAASVPLNGHYPKLLQGDSGSVWLITAPKTGVLVYLSNTPQKPKHKLGYYSTRMVEELMRPFDGPVTISAN